MDAFFDQVQADVGNMFSLGEGVEQVVYTSRSSGVSKEVAAIVNRGQTAPDGGLHKSDGEIYLPESALAPEIEQVRHHDLIEVAATGEQWLVKNLVSRDLGIIVAAIERNPKSTFRE